MNIREIVKITFLCSDDNIFWSNLVTCEVLVFCHVSLDKDPVEYCLVSIHGNLTYFKPFCALDTCNASCGKKKTLLYTFSLLQLV